MGKAMDDNQIQDLLNNAAGWKREDAKWIVKKYRFKQFLSGISFVNEVAQISERLNHHPFISIDYKMVTLRLTSWNAGGLTALDFACAEAYDQAYEAIAAQS